MKGRCFRFDKVAFLKDDETITQNLKYGAKAHLGGEQG